MKSYKMMQEHGDKAQAGNETNFVHHLRWNTKLDYINKLDRSIKAMSDVLKGKESQVKLAVSCFLAEGHLMIEGTPGVGKTTMALMLSKAFGLHSQRVQFTSDIRARHLWGYHEYDPLYKRMQFNPGPIFTNVLLLDEINKGQPCIHGAMLEALEEGQVTIGGIVRELRDPFMVVATKNIVNGDGDYPLSNGFLDRFMMSIQIGFPDARSEFERLKLGMNPTLNHKTIESMFSVSELREMKHSASKIEVPDNIIKYVQKLIGISRQDSVFESSISMRGALSLLELVKAYVFVSGRDRVELADIRYLIPFSWRHRIKVSAPDANVNHVIDQLISIKE